MPGAIVYFDNIADRIVPNISLCIPRNFDSESFLSEMLRRTDIPLDMDFDVTGGE